jgi:hypothetical protein
MKRCQKRKGTDFRKVRERFVDEFSLADGSSIEFVFEDFPKMARSSHSTSSIETSRIARSSIV